MDLSTFPGRQVFPKKLFFSSCRMAGGTYACARVAIEVAEDHLLNYNLDGKQELVLIMQKGLIHDLLLCQIRLKVGGARDS